MNHQSFLQDKLQLEDSVQGFRKHGKLDQNVLSESQLIPRGDAADQNNDESEDFDFDDIGGDDDAGNISIVKDEQQSSLGPAGQKMSNNITKNSLSNILTERAKHDFMR